MANEKRRRAVDAALNQWHTALVELEEQVTTAEAREGRMSAAADPAIRQRVAAAQRRGETA
jgi:hypothetical protein